CPTHHPSRRPSPGWLPRATCVLWVGGEACGGLGQDGPGHTSERNVRRGQDTSSMILTHAENGTAVTLRPGEQVVIRLTEHPTTGFRWAVDQSDEAIVALVDTTYVRTAGAGLGGGGEQV